jgi:hypothetical protein
VLTTNLSLNVNWSRATDPKNLPLTYVLHFFGPSIDTTFATTDTNATFTVSGIHSSSSYILTGVVTNGTDTTPSSSHIPIPTAATLTSIGKSPISVPRTFSLRQNYPNPFNPSTTISFDIPASSYVVLNVYDLLGREVGILVNDRLPPGSYRVQWAAPQLSSGVYFYRLRVDGLLMQTRKMLIAK